MGTGSMAPAFAKLAQKGKGGAACLSARLEALIHRKSIHMMRRLFNAVVKPPVSCGREVWAPACSLVLVTGLKDML